MLSSWVSWRRVSCRALRARLLALRRTLLARLWARAATPGDARRSARRRALERCRAGRPPCARRRKWTLRRADDTYVCTLPCSYWVRPDSGLTLRLEDTARTGIPGVEGDSTSFAVPAQLAGESRREAHAHRRPHAWGLGTLGRIIAAPLAVTFGFMGIAFTALSAASLATGSESTTATASGCTSAAAPNGGPGASGWRRRRTTASLPTSEGSPSASVRSRSSVLCTIWFFHDREGGLRYEEPSARQGAFRLRLRPGAVGLETEEGARAWVSPAGIAGTF